MPPIEPGLTPPPGLVGEPLSARQLVEVLIRHYGLNEGRYELVLGFQIGAGPVGQQPGDRMPGIIIGLQSVGLAATKGGTDDAIDAASVAPSQPAATAPAPAK